MKRKNSNFIAFDLGSSKIAAIAAHITKNGDLSVNSQIVQYSEGLKSGVVTNMSAAENSIITAIYALEQESDKSVKEIAVSLSGVGVKSYYVQHKIKLGNQAISPQDVRKLINKALSEFKIKDREVMHYFPLEFTIDAEHQVDDPVGMYARELSCQLHIVSIDKLMVVNLTECLSKCQVRVSNIFLSCYVSAISCLTSDEKKLGAIFIDLGSHTSTIGIFLDDNMIYTGSIPCGSMDITYDIAKKLSVTIKTADRLKILYGNAHNKLTQNRTIRLDEFEPDNNYNAELSITDTDLAKIIEKRINKILTSLKEQCDQVDVNDLLAKRVILTGGGAAMPGIIHQAETVFNKHARVAHPKLLPGLIETQNHYIYSTVVGMIQTKALQYQKNSFKYNVDENSGLFKRTFLWLKENI